jgi:hypothetical protein
MDEWNTVDLSAFEGVTLYGSNPVDAASKDDYFESLFYSSAVVGLNTSAFLEGAIVGRPVHTILLPEFHENQEGTLHFHYLMTVGGGVLNAGRSFDEHFLQLAGSLRRATHYDPAPFVREFIRPGGLDRPATPIFCDAVDEVLRAPAPAPERTPVRFVLLRWAMLPVLKALRAVYGAEVIRDDWSRKEREQQQRREARQRARDERARAAQQEKQERGRRRAATLAAREAAVQAKQGERQRGEAEKARRKQARVREKAARVRRRERAAIRTRIKLGAKGWLARLRGQGQAT